MTTFFKNKKIHLEIVQEVINKKGDKITSTIRKTRSFFDVWTNDPNIAEYRTKTFKCDKTLVKKHEYNFSKWFNHFEKLEKPKVKLDDIYEHMRSLVNYDESHFNYLLDWLAQLVQYPHILPHTCIILISDEGVGKDVFWTFITNVINPLYTVNVSKLEAICGKFNGLLGGKLLIAINETDPIESALRIENIKYLITAETVNIELKNKDIMKHPHYSRFIFFLIDYWLFLLKRVQEDQL